MDVLEGLWVAAIVVVMLVAIVAVGLIGALAITTGFRQVEAVRRNG